VSAGTRQLHPAEHRPAADVRHRRRFERFAPGSLVIDVSSREISRALIPFLPTVAAGPDSWLADPTIRHAIEIATA
jgi:hypothetical protein